MYRTVPGDKQEEATNIRKVKGGFENYLDHIFTAQVFTLNSNCKVHVSAMKDFHIKTAIHVLDHHCSVTTRLLLSISSHHCVIYPANLL